jgi:hypothetical protein
MYHRYIQQKECYSRPTIALACVYVSDTVEMVVAVSVSEEVWVACCEVL